MSQPSPPTCVQELWQIWPRVIFYADSTSTLVLCSLTMGGVPRQVPVDDSSIGQPFLYSAWNFVIERYNLSNTSLPLRRRPYAHLDLSTPVSVSHNRPSEGSAQVASPRPAS
ncbi:hypothetical protein RhiLY_00114 [Ceratobasidium sp. AG-Ba]|nr:hypothetical protein RhiLY_00114 [Ceratobasidium sp. AG-Ba]